MNNAALVEKYLPYTMVGEELFLQNLDLVDRVAHIRGAVVECGTWRGGMLAAMAEKRPESLVFGFDSFEGLPPAQEIDGPQAAAYQADTEHPLYHNNCIASLDDFRAVMWMAQHQYWVEKGWFRDTIPKFAKKAHPIAVLRLDGDWYESTKVCLENLYPLLQPDGLMIIDDYHAWEGCRKATDEFLEAHDLVLSTKNYVPYLRKPCYDSIH